MSQHTAGLGGKTLIMSLHIEIYQNDIVIKKPKKRKKKTGSKLYYCIKDKHGRYIDEIPQQNESDENKNGKGHIDRLTQRSRNRLKFIASNTSIDFDFITTLTYPRKFPSDGKLVKKHLDLIKKYMVAKGMGQHLWFLEFQKRGAPHVHILHEGAVCKEWLSKTWYRVVGSGDERHLRAGTNSQKVRKYRGGNRYAVKYSSKTYQKDVPEDYQNVGRFWGCSKGVNPKVMARATLREDDLLRALEGWSQFERLGEDSLTYSTLFGAAIDVSEALSKAGFDWSNGRFL